MQNIGFPVKLLKADKMYREENYEDARSEYLELSLIASLNLQQKATASFRLGLCDFKLGKYSNARDSFITSLMYNPNDAVAYNNAAVCSYYMNDYKMAEEYQRKAIAILPVVEYYYNIGRIYEKIEQYSEAVKYYAAFILGEENITKEDRVDPVRVKNKIAKLLPDKKLRDVVTEDLMIALKLKDTRETLMIEDSDMIIKSKDFECKVENSNGINRLHASYKRNENDPYNLIDVLKWTVTSGGQTIYTSQKNEFSIRISDDKDYVVNLYITNNEKKVLHSSKKINNNKGIETQKGYEIAKPQEETCKYYIYASYEQVFEKDFKVSTRGFNDRFNVVWGKDNIEAEIMDKDIMDAASSLYLKNTLTRNAGIWANLSALLEDKNLKGKTINIKFYARKINDSAKIDARATVKGDSYFYAYDDFDLDFRWRQYSLSLYIPDNASSLTFSFNTKPGDEVKIDGFIISVAK